MKIGLKVADAMSQTPVTVQSTKSVLECSKIMFKRNVGSLLIANHDILQGILTEKDLVKFISKGLDSKSTNVKDIMTKKIVIIEPDIDIYDALVKMRSQRVRRLPVIHKNKLVGMLTQNDILKLQPALFDILSEKVLLQKTSSEQICDNCGQKARLKDIDGRMLCKECRTTENIIN